MNTTSNNNRSIHRVVVRLVVIAAASLVVSSSLGQVDLMLFQGPTGSGIGFKDTVGYAFTVRDNPLSAHRLGVYDISGDGLESMNIVGLWLEGGTLLTTAIFPSGRSAPLESGFRWFDLSAPIILNANTTYRIGVQADLEMHPSGFARDLVSPDIALIGAVRNGQQGNLSYPGSTAFPDQAIVGPNLAYTVVPEPSAISLLIAGLVLLAVLRIAGLKHQQCQLTTVQVRKP